MFGTMGLSELILILMIILIVFGAGRLPQIGEGVGKALKGFRKEVHEAPQHSPSEAQQENVQTQSVEASPGKTAGGPSTLQSSSVAKANTPCVPGPELTPGTTASLLYNTSLPPQTQTTPPKPTSAALSNQVISMEERSASPPPTAHASYPPLPTAAQAKATAKRPSAIVNKEAVARVQTQQAALKAKSIPSGSAVGMSPDNLADFGEGLGEVVRTFRQAVSDVRGSVDPHMHTIQAEMDAAQKEIQRSIEAAKERPPARDESSKSA